MLNAILKRVQSFSAEVTTARKIEILAVAFCAIAQAEARAALEYETVK